MAESGGNPSAINNWDSNAAAGHPSKGLLQTIDSTFAAYALPGHNDIWNPVDNAIAAIRYMIDRYGSIYNVWAPRAGGWYGYSVGSRYIPEDMIAMLHQGEAVIPRSEMEQINRLANPSRPYANSGGDVLPESILNGSNIFPMQTADNVARGIKNKVPIKPYTDYADNILSKSTLFTSNDNIAPMRAVSNNLQGKSSKGGTTVVNVKVEVNADIKDEKTLDDFIRKLEQALREEIFTNPDGLYDGVA